MEVQGIHGYGPEQHGFGADTPPSRVGPASPCDALWPVTKCPTGHVNVAHVPESTAQDPLMTQPQAGQFVKLRCLRQMGCNAVSHLGNKGIPSFTLAAEFKPVPLVTRLS